ncbi:hypothetical protein QUB60_13870 [Microcoleus sp. A2-C5]|uniref:hypothetical protein n=1 Tax=Microcoleaceae TaxID=1892252 RepID=UPI002237C384|nr:hypothetical protein [Lyngbya sp. CCAP 1446/10]MCW6053648.1 hypothetical protein [Lyngbya sp. CCAP 1446/10]
MSYRDFDLKTVTKNFSLTISDRINLFSNVPELEPSPLLVEILKENVPIALSSNTDKSRSSMITAPILIELRKLLNHQIGLFCGIDFTVDTEKGLNGNCDFLISHSSHLLMLTAPVVAIVEAQNEDINASLGPCVAEMLAARIFNEREGNPNATITYGAVTSGQTWRFLRFKEQVIEIDLTEYYLRDVNKILGILASAIKSE